MQHFIHLCKNKLFFIVIFLQLFSWITLSYSSANNNVSTNEHKKEETGVGILRPHLSNNWYPSDQRELNNLLRTLGKTAKEQYIDPNILPRVRALIVPHAAYTYSGAVATAGYTQLNSRNYNLIVLLAPSHHMLFGGIALPSVKFFELPNGKVSCNTQEISNLLRKAPAFFQRNNEVFSQEHSIEIQLPFLVRYLPNVPVLPCIIGNIGDEELSTVVDFLRPLLNSKTLFVVSSDFIHYGSSYQYTPYQDFPLERTKGYLNNFFIPLLANNTDALLKFAQESSPSICGLTAIKILSSLFSSNAPRKVMAKNIDSAVLAYGTSAEKNPSKQEEFVSYAAIAWYEKTTVNNHQLTPFLKNSLLQYARDVIANVFDPALLVLPFPSSFVPPFIAQKKGVFVTLYTKEKTGKKILRGCTGRLYGQESIFTLVKDVALTTAFHDSRFPPLTKAEFRDTVIEITILDKQAPIQSYRNIQLGRHGVVLEQQGLSALFLPQVAAQQGWKTREELLAHLSVKAGLKEDGWKDKSTQLSVFLGYHFSE